VEIGKQIINPDSSRPVLIDFLSQASQGKNAAVILRQC
jgi:hypothetical protein